MHQEGRAEGERGHDNNADNCLTDAHKRVSRRLRDVDLFMCFVNIHGLEYFCISTISNDFINAPFGCLYGY